MGVLNEAIEKENLLILSSLIIDQKLDTEFEGMIMHYYAVSDWYFDHIFDFSPFNKIISEKHISSPLLRPFENRGQMGRYWNSLSFENW